MMLKGLQSNIFENCNKKKQIDETVKNIITVDTKTLEINMLNTKTLQDGLKLTQENKELAE